MSGTVQIPTFESLGAKDVAALKLQNAGTATLDSGLTSFGQVFAQGALAAGEDLVARIGLSTSAVQLDVKSYWEDGSVKMAVVTLARPEIAAGLGVDVVLGLATTASAKAAAAAAPVNLAAALSGHGFTVDLTLQGKATQSIDVLAALKSALAAGTADFWQEGPLASQARIEIPVGGSQRLVFDVTAWKGGELSVDAQFNNDIAMGTSGGTVSYSAVVRMDGAVVANESVTQSQYQNWHQSFSTSDVDGGQGLGDPASGWLNIQHDVEALAATGAVASYDLSVGVSQSLLNSYASATNSSGWGGPLDTYDIWTNMPSAGARADIGIVTQANTAWLMTQDARAAAYAMGQAEGAGSVPWHYWDEGHDTWLNTDNYPRVWTDPRGGTGTAGSSSSTGLTQQVPTNTSWTPDTAHQPELSFVPYLLTGERWILDNLYAQASYSIMSTWSDLRMFAQDLIAREQGVRPIAWGLRELENAAFAAPDGSVEQVYFREAADANWAWLVSQIPQWTAEEGEAYGWIPPGAGVELKPWMQDYVASTAIAAAKRGSEDALTFLKWQANFLVGRFTNEANGFNPHDGINYAVAYAATDGGTTFTTWKQIGDQTAALGWSNGNGWGSSDGNFAQIALSTLAGIYEVTGSQAAADAYWWLLGENPPYVSESTYASDPTFSLDLPPGGGVLKSITGGAAMLTGGRGDDTLNGGSGNDTLVGGSGEDRLVANSGHDSVVGGTGSDSLWGSDGNDTLDGGTGIDFLVGGAGNDVYIVDGARDHVREFAGGGIDLVRATASFALSANVENLMLIGTGNHRGFGNNLANTITGNGQDNVLNGGGGNDTLIGGAGADSLLGGTGADSMAGGLGDDRYGVDNAGDRVIEDSGAGIDRVVSTISFTLPANVERLNLVGAGTMTGTGNALANTIVGNGGPSVLQGLAGNDVLYGGGGGDTLEGGSGKDWLFGQAGRDNLAGGDGNDVLVGGAAVDTLTGGAGADHFRFTAAGDFGDVITDFAPGEDYVEILRGAIGKLLPAGALSAAHFTEGTTASGAGAQFLYDDASGALRWDADGSGGTASVLVATLTGAPHLTASDILLMG